MFRGGIGTEKPTLASVCLSFPIPTPGTGTEHPYSRSPREGASSMWLETPEGPSWAPHTDPPPKAPAKPLLCKSPPGPTRQEMFWHKRSSPCTEVKKVKSAHHCCALGSITLGMKGSSALHTKSLPKDVPGFMQKKEGPRGTIKDGWWGWRKLKDHQGRLRGDLVQAGCCGNHIHDSIRKSPYTARICGEMGQH